MIHHLHTVDAHAAGEPLRMILGGFPEPRGETMLDKRAWLERTADHLRRALMLEPRGHQDMYGALLTRPVRPDSDAGVLFMHNEGYSTMCGHGVVAIGTLVFERGLLTTREPNVVVLDTPAGQVRARANVVRRSGHGAASDIEPLGREDAPESITATRVTSVAFENVPSFVLHAGLPVRAANRDIRVDVAFGGAFYAIVDAEAVGLPIHHSRLQDLRRVGMEIKHAVEAARQVVHPLDPGLKGIYGTIFTGPAHKEGSDLRNVTVFADAEVDRSPCGTGTCAVMAVLDGMSLLPEGRPFVHEGIVDTTFRGRVLRHTTVGEFRAIVPELEGSAWITGEHHFMVDDEDPLKDGFRI
jgi:trans-L-3-hydroxyproline dehydratase